LRDIPAAKALAKGFQATAASEAELRVFVHGSERYLVVNRALTSPPAAVDEELNATGSSLPERSNKTEIRVFFSYSHVDEDLRDQLEKHLSALKRKGIITSWHDRRIHAGQEFAKEIDEHVEGDDIILLLVSSDFISSDYCYNKEMLRALARHESNAATVIPVILRACDWQDTPFGKLNAIPVNGKPVVKFDDRDEAWVEVVRAIRQAVLHRMQLKQGRSVA
jgi:hypothetical protein